jgi:ketosteroid isomerase-like protein
MKTEISTHVWRRGWQNRCHYVRIHQLVVTAIAAFCLAIEPLFGQEKTTPSERPNPFQAIPANPSLVKQIEAASQKFDEVFNQHDREGVLALFTPNATQISPVGTFVGRDAIGKFYDTLFQNLNPHDRATKIHYVYAFGGDLCALGGWVVTIHGSQQAGGFLINVYTQSGGSWKIRTAVFKYATGP